ncbi:hypothetical protein [Janthinobacterium sp. S3M3]|uniref:hypothetical protein n=1 Tax=Janthinobacterium sp. S3M3 TaxID=2723078 RepID=UPI001622444B|nr:hypothetical protein [Janthinobacterium sp. S3M3]
MVYLIADDVCLVAKQKSNQSNVFAIASNMDGTGGAQELCERHPDLKVELTLSNKMQDLCSGKRYCRAHDGAAAGASDCAPWRRWPGTGIQLDTWITMHEDLRNRPAAGGRGCCNRPRGLIKPA